MQLGIGVGADIDIRDRQLDRVLAKARQARPAAGRNVRAIHTQCLEALLRRPFGKVRVEALAREHERRKQCDALAAVVAQHTRGNRFLGLRLDRHRAVGAVLRAELHV